MKVSSIQMNMAFSSPEENYRRAEELIRKAVKDSAPDTVVLPETWNLGFFPHDNLFALSDKEGERTKSLLSSLSKELNVNIVGGSVVRSDGDDVRNTCYVYSRTGELVASYDKTHLFSPMDEDKFFKKGDHISLFTLDGVKCGVIICYDIRFPELIRTMALQGMDVLFVVSQWPKVRVPHLMALTRARAIENQMFLVLCNSAGKAGETQYGGSSLILSPWGEVLSSLEDEKEYIISATLDMGIVSDIRNSINVFSDRRPELYNL
ncbi:MAG: carbon-nitrogen family hydrolase [Candidatus Ornithospirochaeta sp.]